jgi:hypothetical protein
MQNYVKTYTKEGDITISIILVDFSPTNEENAIKGIHVPETMTCSAPKG